MRVSTAAEFQVDIADYRADARQVLFGGGQDFVLHGVNRSEGKPVGAPVPLDVVRVVVDGGLQPDLAVPNEVAEKFVSTATRLSAWQLSIWLSRTFRAEAH